MFASNRMNLFIAGLIGLLTLNGCSFSHSSESSSDSSGSVSDSIGSFSGSSTSSFSRGSRKYEADVVDYTYAYLKSSADTDYEGFQKGLSDIAEKRGISDWESDSHTYTAIGKALKKARIEGVSYETYKKNFSDSDATKMKQIQQGYDSRD